MTRILAIVAALVAITLLSSATYTAPKRAPIVNESFLFATNDNLMEAVAAYAEAICVQDKATGYTAQEWTVAASRCADTYRSDTDDDSSDDGGWQAYRLQAYNEVKAACGRRGNADELCEWFR